MMTDNKTHPKAHLELLENYLSEKSTNILAVRQEKILQEIEQKNQVAEREAFHNIYKEKYKQAIKEAQNRFLSEKQLCEKIYSDTLLPLLLEIKSFAESHNIFPLPKNNSDKTVSDEIPDNPIRCFSTPNIPYIDDEIEFYKWSNNDDVISVYEKKVGELAQKHVTLQCGVAWGFNGHESRYSSEDGWGNTYYTDEYYVTSYGIKISVTHNGNIELSENTFTIKDVETEIFTQALGDAFYHPAKIGEYERKPPSQDKSAPAQTPKSKLNKATEAFSTFAKKFISIWREPKEEIKTSDPFIKKLWFGFPTDKNREEHDDEYDL